MSLVKTKMLGLIGTTQNGTPKTEVHYDSKAKTLQLVQCSGYVVACIQVSTARELSAHDVRWQVAIALYDLNVYTGAII